MTSHEAAYSVYRVETPENISFEYELAGPGTRMAAYFVDFILLSILIGALSGASFWIGNYPKSNIEDIVFAITIALIAIFYPLGGYFILFEYLMNGQTPGKKMLGIRAVRENGLHLDLLQIITRNVFRVIDCSFPFQYSIGGFMLIFSQHTRRIGDLMADSIVIKESKVETAQKYSWKSTSIHSRMTGAVDLSHTEFNFLLEYIAVYKNLTEEDRSRIASKLVHAFNEKHSLSEKPDLQPLFQKLNTSPPEKRFHPAELILKRVLSHFEK